MLGDIITDSRATSSGIRRVLEEFNKTKSLSCTIALKRSPFEFKRLFRELANRAAWGCAVNNSGVVFQAGYEIGKFDGHNAGTLSLPFPRSMPYLHITPACKKMVNIVSGGVRHSRVTCKSRY